MKICSNTLNFDDDSNATYRNHNKNYTSNNDMKCSLTKVEKIKVA